MLIELLPFISKCNRKYYCRIEKDAFTGDFSKVELELKPKEKLIKTGLDNINYFLEMELLYDSLCP